MKRRKLINNHEAQRIIESWSWNDTEEESDLFLTTRRGGIKRKATHTQTSSIKSKKLESLSTESDNDNEAGVSLSSMTQAMENDHTYCAYEESDTCKNKSSCQTKLCFKYKKEIMAILQENERTKK